MIELCGGAQELFDRSRRRQQGRGDLLSAEDFMAALKGFRADARKGTVMNRIAKGLDDADIEAMGTHFASLRQR